MNRTLKISIYSIILIIAFLNKCGRDIIDYTDGVDDRMKREYVKPKNEYSPSTKTQPSSTSDEFRERQRNTDEYTPIDLKLPITQPNSGYSPYDSWYGKGIYHQTENSIEVTAPIERDIVFLLRDLSSQRTIRNEYVRAGRTFSLTKIPYGNYKFYYTYGNDWSNLASFKDQQKLGNFTSNKGVSKSDDYRDFEFERGYTGAYTLKLQMVVGGNLGTEAASEDEL
jgi:hypothetical protein